MRKRNGEICPVCAIKTAQSSMTKTYETQLTVYFQNAHFADNTYYRLYLFRDVQGEETFTFPGYSGFHVGAALFFQKYLFLNLKFSLGCSEFSVLLFVLWLLCSFGFDFREKEEFIFSMSFFHFHSKHLAFPCFIDLTYFLDLLGFFYILFLFTWDVFFLWTVFPSSQLYLLLSYCFSLLWLSTSFPC